MYPPIMAAEVPDLEAYIMAGSGERITFASLDETSNQFAHLLRSHGVVAGDTLALFMPNNLSWPVAVASGMRTGLLVTPINWHIGTTELLPMLEDARPAAVVTTTELTDIVFRAMARADLRPLVLTVDGQVDGSVDFWAAIADQPETPVEGELLGARVLFSGGTTGRPKAFRQPLLGIHPLDAPARHPALAEKLGIARGIRFLSPAPSYHAAPFTFQLMTLAAGGSVVCMEGFDAVGALQAIDRHRVTHSQWVPTMLSRLVDLPERPKPSSSHVVAVTSGAPCPPELKETINDWWGNVLHEYYGASEGYGHTYISPEESRRRRGSVGRPLGSAVVRVVDHDGSDVAAGKIGRVCFQTVLPDGSTVLKGMGDMGRLDGDGYLYLTGRQSFMIISGGVNIYPEEIESTLVAHPLVADAAVFGLPHPDLGEQVVAVVELKEGVAAGDATRQLLLDHCRARLARYKAPRRFEFVERLPRLPTGKLNKHALQRDIAGE